MSVGVENVNDAPVLRYDRVSLPEDQPWVLDSRALSRFVHDADGDRLSAPSQDGGTGAGLAEQILDRLRKVNKGITTSPSAGDD